jgi:tetratricopeptide (TPR) repeat protein
LASQLIRLRIFLASPDGLTEERSALRAEVDEYNESEAKRRGFLFEVVGWEDVLGGVGRPQSQINDEVRTCDFFVLMLWDHWGSPPDVQPSRYSSGSEEEYHVAREAHDATDLPMKNLLMLFKAVDANQMSAPGAQLQKVLDFRRAIEESKAHFYKTFDSIATLKVKIRRYLAAWLYQEEHPLDRDQTVVEELLAPERAIAEAPASGLEPPGTIERALTTKAWQLAEAGRLTEAEVEFSKAVVGRQQPEAFVSFGLFLNRLGRLDQAKAIFERAVEVAIDRSDNRSLADAQLCIGMIYEARGNLTIAELNYRDALGNYERIGHLLGVAASYNSLGSVLHTRGEIDDAEKMFRQTLEIGDQLQRPELQASGYNGLGLVLRTRGDLAGAADMHRKALEIAERLGVKEAIATESANLGLVLRDQGSLDAAEQLHRKALGINQELSRIQGIANVYKYLSQVLYTRGNFAEAERLLQKAIPLYDGLGDLSGLAECYGNLALLLFSRGELGLAETMHGASLHISRKLGKTADMARSYSNLGNVLLRRRDLDGAERMYREALKLDERLGRAEGIASNYAGLGIILDTRGNLDEAEQMYRKSLEIAQKSGQLEGQAVAYGNLGVLFRKRGDLKAAEEMLRQSLEIEEGIGRVEGMASDHENLGDLLREKGELDEAEQMFRKMLSDGEELQSQRVITRAKWKLAHLRDPAY